MEAGLAEVLVLVDEPWPRVDDAGQCAAGRVAADLGVGEGGLLVFEESRVYGNAADGDAALAPNARRHSVRGRSDRVCPVYLWTEARILAQAHGGFAQRGTGVGSCGVTARGAPLREMGFSGSSLRPREIERAGVEGAGEESDELLFVGPAD